MGDLLRAAELHILDLGSRDLHEQLPSIEVRFPMRGKSKTRSGASYACGSSVARAGAPLTSGNEKLLKRLTDYVVWAGRYPIPVDLAQASTVERTLREPDLDDIEKFIVSLERGNLEMNLSMSLRNR